jgi:ADP-heptose:LPS heptosyltransferase
MAPPSPPGRILCLSEGQLGDLLILTPALRALKESFPAAHLAVVILQRRFYDRQGASAIGHPVVRRPVGGTAAVPLNDPHVDAVAEIDRTLLREESGISRIRAEAGIIRWLRAQRFDTVICTFPQDRFFVWAFLSGADVRVGEGDSLLLNRRIHAGKGEGGVLKYYCRLAEGAGAKVSSYETHFTVPDSADAAAVVHLRSLGLPDRGYVAVHPGASGAYRIWPPGSYARVIDGLQEESRVPVLLCGGEFDREVVEEVRASCTHDVKMVIVSEGVELLAALLKRASLCLSNNSGPRHLAIAVGTPSLAVIPRFDDREWKIYPDESRCATEQSTASCPACGAHECRNLIPEGERFGSHCMRAVSADSVLRRITSMLPLH